MKRRAATAGIWLMVALVLIVAALFTSGRLHHPMLGLSAGVTAVVGAFGFRYYLTRGSR